MTKMQMKLLGMLQFIHKHLFSRVVILNPKVAYLSNYSRLNLLYRIDISTNNKEFEGVEPEGEMSYPNIEIPKLEDDCNFELDEDFDSLNEAQDKLYDNPFIQYT